MPVLFVHGIGVHDLERYQARFSQLRDRLQAELANTGRILPDHAWIPVFWGDWGPAAYYTGQSLGVASHTQPTPTPKSALLAPADPGLATLRELLATPGPLREILEIIRIPEEHLLHAAALTAGRPQRAALVCRRLQGRTRPHGHRRPAPLRGHWAALEAILELAFAPPRA
ncbi:MAG TPA: hypothetical protein PKA05_12490, partial [Roseiflexaceae bacterium]|nr:hypothetical protein [Roseiflexaceae bacterium]